MAHFQKRAEEKTPKNNSLMAHFHREEKLRSKNGKPDFRLRDALKDRYQEHKTWFDGLPTINTLFILFRHIFTFVGLYFGVHQWKKCQGLSKEDIRE